MTTSAAPRRARWSGLDLAAQVNLAADDLDEHDSIHEDIRKELARIRGVLVGILISVTTASLLLVVNIAVVAR